MPPEDELAPDDVRGDVAAALASLKSPEGNASGDSGDAQTDAGIPSSAEAATPERPRDEHGRFAPKPVEQQSAAPEQQKNADTDPSQANVAQPSPADEAPKGWSADAKTKWSSLDPSIRAEVHRRETQTEEAGRRWSQEKSTYEQTLAPLRQAAQRSGVTAEQGLQRLLAANDYLNRDPVTAIKWLAQQYRVDLARLASAGPADPSPQPSSTPQAPQPAPVDPQLYERLSTVEQMLNQEAQHKTLTAIEQFASAPGHDHFEAVKQDMGRLMLLASHEGRVVSLQDAYDTAVWANPTTRAAMLAAQTASVTKQQQDREAAEKARRGAGLGINGSPNGRVTAPAKEYDTVEEATRAAFREHSSRAH